MPEHKLDQFRNTLFEDGIAKQPGMLSPAHLARARECYDWSVSNWGPRMFDGSDERSLYKVDANNPRALDVYRETVLSLPFGDFLREVWGSEHIWLYSEEVFWKEGVVERGGWHQDLAYLPATGEHWVNCWIPFESLPASHSIEVIRGSHHGVLYEGMSFDENEPGSPQPTDGRRNPPIPDIEAERIRDPNAWDILSYAVEPGDVVFLHPGALHNGAPVDAQVPERHTLVLRFFGDDAVWTDLPDHQSALREDQKEASPTGGRAKPGEPFRSAKFLQLC